MYEKRVFVFCVLLTLSAAVLQAAPRIFGSALAFAVLLNGFPVYIAARLSYARGFAVYLSAAILLGLINTGEAFFFICTNGVIGLSLGIAMAPAISALLDTAILFIVNYLFGISIFSSPAFNAPILEALLIFPPMYLYCFLYLKLSMPLDSLLHRYIELNTHTLPFI
jgi:hypothetical protein